MPKDTKTLGNSKARACESLGFVHKKGCARVLTQPHYYYLWAEKHLIHNEKAEFKPEASVFADLITPVQRPPDSRPPAQRTE